MAISFASRLPARTRIASVWRSPTRRSNSAAACCGWCNPCSVFKEFSMAGFSLGTMLAAYAGSALVFFALDFVWLTIVAIGIYRSEIGTLLLEKPPLMAAGASALFFVAGIGGFAVLPALSAQAWARPLMAC